MSRESSPPSEGTVQQTTRRGALAALGSAVVAGLAGCSSGSGSNAAQATSTATATATATETATSTPSKLQQQLATVKEATAKYADLVQNHPSLRTLHVWVHAENPDGVFASMNPEYGSGHGH